MNNGMGVVPHAYPLHLKVNDMKYKQGILCCDKLKDAVANEDLRYNTRKDICIGTNPIVYCPFCGELLCWRWAND